MSKELGKFCAAGVVVALKAFDSVPKYVVNRYRRRRLHREVTLRPQLGSRRAYIYPAEFPGRHGVGGAGDPWSDGSWGESPL
jgi:hypothetical protein